MSVSNSNLEDRVFNWIWRALVIGGLLTVLGGVFTPTHSPQTQGQMQGAANAASVAEPSANPAITGQSQ